MKNTSAFTAVLLTLLIRTRVRKTSTPLPETSKSVTHTRMNDCVTNETGGKGPTVWDKMSLSCTRRRAVMPFFVRTVK